MQRFKRVVAAEILAAEMDAAHMRRQRLDRRDGEDAKIGQGRGAGTVAFPADLDLRSGRGELDDMARDGEAHRAQGGKLGRLDPDAKLRCAGGERRRGAVERDAGLAGAGFDAGLVLDHMRA